MDINVDKFKAYLRNKGLKPRTIDNYVYYFNKFTETYATFNQKTVSSFMYDPKMVNTISRSFLKNLRWYLLNNKNELELSEESIRDINEVELPKVTGRKQVRLPKPIPESQISLIEKYLPSEKEKIQLNLSFYCGLRVGELVKIRIRDFNWDIWKDDRDSVGECIVYGKGDKEGIALVPSWLMDRISKWIKSMSKSGYFGDGINSRLFRSKNSKAKDSSLIRLWEDKLRKAGIDSGVTKFDGDGKVIYETSVYPHRLRHSYASHLASEGVDIIRIKELVRHSSINSTQIYTHISKGSLKEDIEKTFSKP